MECKRGSIPLRNLSLEHVSWVVEDSHWGCREAVKAQLVYDFRNAIYEWCISPQLLQEFENQVSLEVLCSISHVVHSVDRSDEDIKCCFREDYPPCRKWSNALWNEVLWTSRHLPLLLPPVFRGAVDVNGHPKVATFPTVFAARSFPGEEFYAKVKENSIGLTVQCCQGAILLEYEVNQQRNVIKEYYSDSRNDSCIVLQLVAPNACNKEGTNSLHSVELSSVKGRCTYSIPSGAAFRILSTSHQGALLSMEAFRDREHSPVTNGSSADGTSLSVPAAIDEYLKELASVACTVYHRDS